MMKSWNDIVEYGKLCVLEKYSANDGLLTRLNCEDEYWWGASMNNVYIFPRFTIFCHLTSRMSNLKKGGRYAIRDAFDKNK